MDKESLNNNNIIFQLVSGRARPQGSMFDHRTIYYIYSILKDIKVWNEVGKFLTNFLSRVCFGKLSNSFFLLISI